MYTLSLIGIGAGNPRHLTLEAIDALNGCDLILIPLKGADKDDLAQLRREICASVLTRPVPRREFSLPRRDPSTPDYLARVQDWHDAIADCWQAEILAGLPDGGRVGFLVWGDPSLYDSTLRIAEVMLDKGGAFAALDDPALHIWWSAYAGMAGEIRISGPLHAVSAKILATRAEARAAHGWIMDIYLLRRGG